MQYGITHKQGNYQIVLVEMQLGFSAHIFDTKRNCVTVLHAQNESATYDACLKWASANIRGEFQLASVELSPLNFGMTAAA